MTKEEVCDLSEKIAGLSTREEKEALWDLAMQHIPEGGLAIEIGTWTGGSAVIIGEVCKQKNARLLCIDGFTTDMNGVRMGLQVDCFKTVADHCRDLPVDYMIGDSTKLVKLLGSEVADFIFVDGCHWLPDVKTDIDGYYKVMKKGGLYCGHDYNDTCEVRGVVDDLFPKVDLHGRVWSVVK